MKKRALALLLVLCTLLTLSPVFSEPAAAASITAFQQTDSRWKDVKYGYRDAAGTVQAYIGKGGSGDVGSGCGVLALTNAVYYLNGTFIEPKVIAEYSVKNGHRVNGTGTAFSLYKAFADANGSKYGFAYVTSVSGYSNLRDNLNKGYVSICSKPGHIMAIVDYNSSNQTYLLLDSVASSNRGTAKTGYAWKTASQLDSIDLRSTFYILKSTGKPAAPTIKSTTNITENSLTLNWSSVSGASSYRVDRRKPGDEYATIKSGITGTSFTDTGLESGQKYWYRVYAVNKAGTSPKQDGYAAWTKCAMVEISSAKADSDTAITIQWGAVKGATSYRVDLRKTNEEYSTAKTGLTGTSYTATGLQANTKYYFRVYAINEGGTSAKPGGYACTTLTVAQAQGWQYLNLNGYYNGTEEPNLGSWGTADVYVNGKLAADDVTDYYVQHPRGTTYEFKDIKANPGYVYEGVRSGSLSGTITDVTKTVLKFAPAKYTVTFDARGGTAESARTVTYGEAYGALPTPKRAGCRFLGWFTAPENGSQVTDATVVTATNNHTLYACWETVLTITKQPAGFSGTVGQTASFTVTAQGSQLTYRWEYSADGGKTWTGSGGTGATESRVLTADCDGLLYRCVVTEGGGVSLTSSSAKITVLPAVTSQPKAASGKVGEKVQFSVTATGRDLTYQWQYSTDNGKTWNASSSTGTIATCTLSTASRDGWLYRCVVRSGNGSEVVSNTAKVSVKMNLIAGPKNASGVVGQKVTFSVQATGAALRYKWEYSADGGRTWKASSSTSATATCTLTTAERDGWLYRCTVSDRYGVSAVSSSAKVTVLPNITTQPKNAAAALGQKAQFTIAATGRGLTYQWQYSTDGGKTWKASSSTSTTATCTLSSADRDGWLYRCIVKSSNGKTVTSNTAKVSVKTALKITSQPVRYVGPVGDTAKFTVKAEGTGLTYQWQYSTNNGETWSNSSSKSATATCAIRDGRDGWLYRCVITDAFGEKITSSSARLLIS